MKPALITTFMLAFAGLAACGGANGQGAGGGLSGTLYFESNTPMEGTQIMARDMATGELRVMLDGLEPAAMGEEIAYLAFCEPLSVRITVADSDGFTSPISECFDIDIGARDAGHVAISPDGQRLAVTRHRVPVRSTATDIGERIRNMTRRESATFIYGRDGTQLAKFTDFGPAIWSRDGDLILAGMGGEAGYGLYSVNADLTRTTRIDDGRLSGPVGAFSAHARADRLAFIHNSAIFEMDLGDGKPARIHSHAYPIAALTYAPRGDAIAFVTQDPLSEALQTGNPYAVFILEDGATERVDVPFIPGGTMSWVK